MDDYEEYARMAKMITNIYARPKKEYKVDQESIENNNSHSNDSIENKSQEEEIKEEYHAHALKFKFADSSALDASMEEEKEPLQNLICNNMSNNRGFTKPKDVQMDKSTEENNIGTKLGSHIDGKFAVPDKTVLSGSSLFGSKTNVVSKKPKGKKKKMRRI